MRHPSRHPAWALVAVAPLLFGFKLFESRNGEVELGNAALQAGKAEDALAHYDKAAAKLPADPGLHLDRGAALYALSRFAEAGQEFLRATEAQDESLKATAFRNLGNALSKQDKPKDAIEAYKRALALRPDDKAAKWNLEIALRKQREKEEEEKKKNDQNKDDDKDKNKKDDKKKDDKDKDKDKKDDKEKDKQDKKSEQDKQDKQDKKDEKKHHSQQQPEKPAQEQPERIQQMLQNLEANPKDLERERARLRAVRRMPPARDW
jgi:Ca-activated chloride channel homolog